MSSLASVLAAVRTGGAAEPGVADFADVGRGEVVARVAFGPGPALDVEEAGGAEDEIVVDADGREGDGGAGVAQGEGGFDVARGVGDALRDGTPLVEGGVDGGGGDQGVDVVVAEGFEADVGAGKGGGVEGHASFHTGAPSVGRQNEIHMRE